MKPIRNWIRAYRLLIIGLSTLLLAVLPGFFIGTKAVAMIMEYWLAVTGIPITLIACRYKHPSQPGYWPVGTAFLTWWAVCIYWIIFLSEKCPPPRM